jgi:hypothetical protein
LGQGKQVWRGIQGSDELNPEQGSEMWNRRQEPELEWQNYSEKRNSVRQGNGHSRIQDLKSQQIARRMAT